jgi:hypothetical protein
MIAASLPNYSIEVRAGLERLLDLPVAAAAGRNSFSRSGRGGGEAATVASISLLLLPPQT